VHRVTTISMGANQYWFAPILIVVADGCAGRAWKYLVEEVEHNNLPGYLLF